MEVQVPQGQGPAQRPPQQTASQPQKREPIEVRAVGVDLRLGQAFELVFKLALAAVFVFALFSPALYIIC